MAGTGLSASEEGRTPVVGLVVNPVAGMGGRVGLKGTDGDATLAEARRRGAEPPAPERVGRFLTNLASDARRVAWLTAAGDMGADAFTGAGLEAEVVHVPAAAETTAADTRAACEAFLARGAGLIVFCGGDGTARDVHAVVGDRCLVLGMPSGVKMYSGVFAVSPEAAADVLRLVLGGRAEEGDGEVADVDEEAYRRGELAVTLHGHLRVVRAPMLVQSMKSASVVAEEADYQEAIAKYVVELLREAGDTLAVLGAGTTVEAIARELGVAKTPLGVDVVRDGAVVAADASEAEILAAITAHGGGPVRVVVSPIGAQGFVLGRGTQQISPAVLAASGDTGALIVAATPHKVAGMELLRVDTGDAALDARLSGWRRVVVGYHEMRMMRVEGPAGPGGGA